MRGFHTAWSWKLVLSCCTDRDRLCRHLCRVKIGLKKEEQVWSDLKILILKKKRQRGKNNKYLFLLCHSNCCVCVINRYAYVYICTHIYIHTYVFMYAVCTYKNVCPYYLLAWHVPSFVKFPLMQARWCRYNPTFPHSSQWYYKSKKPIKITVSFTVGEEREAEGRHTWQLPNALWCWTLTNHWQFCPSCSQFLWSGENEK